MMMVKMIIRIMKSFHYLLIVNYLFTIHLLSLLDHVHKSSLDDDVRKFTYSNFLLILIVVE